MFLYCTEYPEKESGDTAQIAETLAKLEISTTHEEKVVDNFAANSSNLNSSSAKQETVEPKKVTIIEPKKNSGIEQQAKHDFVRTRNTVLSQKAKQTWQAVDKKSSFTTGCATSQENTLTSNGNKSMYQNKDISKAKTALIPNGGKTMSTRLSYVAGNNKSPRSNGSLKNSVSFTPRNVYAPVEGTWAAKTVKSSYKAQTSQPQMTKPNLAKCAEKKPALSSKEVVWPALGIQTDGKNSSTVQNLRHTPQGSWNSKNIKAPGKIPNSAGAWKTGRK